jgi:hypothetical protein
MPNDVADWTTAVGAPWVAVGGKTTAGVGPDSFDTSAVKPEAQTLGIVVEGGVLNTIGPIHVVGKTTGTAYQVNFAGQQTGMVVVRIRPDLDSQYTVSWSTSSGAGVVVSAATSPLDFTYPALGQQGMAASIPVVIASDQTPLLINTSTGLDVDANIDEVGGAAFGLGPRAQASGLPVSMPTDLPLSTKGQQAMVASLPVVIASDQAAFPVSPAGGQFDVDANLDEVGGVAVSLGQKVAASSLPVVIASDQAVAANGQKTMAASVPVVIASDQSAIPVTLPAGGSDVDANIDEVGGAAFTLGVQNAAQSLPVVIAQNSAAGRTGQQVMGSSLPVVIASDQSSIPVATVPPPGVAFASAQRGIGTATFVTPLLPGAKGIICYLNVTLGPGNAAVSISDVDPAGGLNAANLVLISTLAKGAGAGGRLTVSPDLPSVANVVLQAAIAGQAAITYTVAAGLCTFSIGYAFLL